MQQVTPNLQLLCSTDAGALVRVPLLRVHAAAGGRRGGGRGRRRARAVQRPGAAAARARRPRRVGQRHRHLASLPCVS